MKLPPILVRNLGKTAWHGIPRENQSQSQISRDWSQTNQEIYSQAPNPLTPGAHWKIIHTQKPADPPKHASPPQWTAGAKGLIIGLVTYRPFKKPRVILANFRRDSKFPALMYLLKAEWQSYETSQSCQSVTWKIVFLRNFGCVKWLNLF